MKHLVIGIVLLALILGASLGAAGALDAMAGDMEPLLRSAWEASLRGELDTAQGRIREAREIWEASYGLAASLVDHERLEDINNAFGELETRARQENVAEYAQVCRDLLQKAKDLAEAEKLHYYNFLCLAFRNPAHGSRSRSR